MKKLLILALLFWGCSEEELGNCFWTDGCDLNCYEDMYSKQGCMDKEYDHNEFYAQFEYYKYDESNTCSEVCQTYKDSLGGYPNCGVCVTDYMECDIY